jgi:hypothetical protein
MRDTENRDDDLNFGEIFNGRRQQPERTGSKPEFKRKKQGRTGTAPTSFNGIHRRRKKRVMW